MKSKKELPQIDRMYMCVFCVVRFGFRCTCTSLSYVQLQMYTSSTLFSYVTDVRMCHLNHQGGLPMYIYILQVVILGYRCVYISQVVRLSYVKLGPLSC